MTSSLPSTYIRTLSRLLPIINYYLDSRLLNCITSTTMAASIKQMLSYLGAGGLLSQMPFMSDNNASSSSTPAHSAVVAYTPFSAAPSCPTDGATSCHNSTTVADSCCFIYPGGQLLQTQFWDASPAIGPDDSWTLHGLWYVRYLHSASIDTDAIFPGPIFVMVLTTSSVPKHLIITTSLKSLPQPAKPIF